MVSARIYGLGSKVFKNDYFWATRFGAVGEWLTRVLDFSCFDADTGAASFS